MKHKQSALRLMQLFAILLLGCGTAFAQSQNRSVKGTIVDASSGEPIIGAYIAIGGSSGKNGAVTDLDGNFTLSVPSSTRQNAVYTAVCVGYCDTDATLSELLSGTPLRMEIKSELLEETVVVGYGTQKKVSSVGSISQTNGDELMKSGNINSVSEALQGKLNGVVTINTTGQPGDNAASIFIRGKSSWQDTNPLVLVDGIERNMNDVDFSEIESVSVLKDASATAVYGVRGGNGVILVTTKRGSSEKPRVSFNVNVGLKSPTAVGGWADYITAMKMYNEACANEGKWDQLYSDSTIAAWQNAIDSGIAGPYNDVFPQVNWPKEIVHTGVSENYNININGKSAFMRYFASVGYQHDGSIYNIPKNDEYDPRAFYNRLTWRANFDFDLTKTTTLSINVAGKMGIKNSQFYADVYQKLTLAPTNDFPIKYADGYWGDSAADQGANPIANITNGGQVTDKSFQGWYDLKLVQKLDFITEGLKIHGQISYNSASSNKNRIRTGGIFGGADFTQFNSFPREYRTYDYANPAYDENGNISYNILKQGYYGNRYYTLPVGTDFDLIQSVSNRLYYELGIDWGRNFKGHEIYVMALFNRQKVNTTKNNDIFNFPAFREDWVGRVTYNWKERYLAEANISYTGSEKFAPANASACSLLFP